MPIEALLLHGGVSGCALSTHHFKITLFLPGPSKNHVKKKREMATSSSLKCNTEA